MAATAVAERLNEVLPLASPAHLALWATADQPCTACGGDGVGCPSCRGTGRGGWHLYRWAALLNRRLVDLAARRITRLIVVAPVRHGKSELCSVWFPAWYLATHPDHRVIVTGHSTEFAEGFGARARDILVRVGPSIGVHVSDASAARGRWDLAPPHRGGLIAVGVGAAPTGRGGHLVIIDDPIKDAVQAWSPTYRERIWDWWRMAIRTRFEPGAVCVIIMSRWHPDDLVGRLLANQGTDGDRWAVLHLPALADPALVWPDPLGRRPGEALCPERFSAEALRDARDGPDGVGPIAFAALYQGQPVVEEGAIFPRSAWRFAAAPPEGLRWVRWWDLAATAASAGEDPDWTAGALVARDADGITWIADVRRIRAEPGETEAFLRATAIEDAARWGDVRIRIPQDPGAAGKAWAAHLIRQVLHAWDVRAVAMTGDKRARAMPLAGQVAAGNVVLVRGAWNEDFVAEAAAFDPPRSAGHDDMVDAVAMAYQDLAGLIRRRARLVL